MKTKECLDYFGSHRKIAEALNIKPPSIYTWGDYPPALRQLQIQVITNGRLKAEPSILSFPVEEEQRA